MGVPRRTVADSAIQSPRATIDFSDSLEELPFSQIDGATRIAHAECENCHRIVPKTQMESLVLGRGDKLAGLSAGDGLLFMAFYALRLPTDFRYQARTRRVWLCSQCLPIIRQARSRNGKRYLTSIFAVVTIGLLGGALVLALAARNGMDDPASRAAALKRPTPAQSAAAAADLSFLNTPDIEGQRPAFDSSQFASQVKSCFRVLPSESTQSVTVTVDVNLRQDGTLQGPPKTIAAPDSDMGRSVARSAEKALVECSPYHLPSESYSEWKSISITFDSAD